MKVLASLFFILAFGGVNATQACQLDFEEVALFYQEGVTDWDNETDEMVVTYPKVEKFMPPLPDQVKAQIQYRGECAGEVEVSLEVYPYSGPYGIHGGEDAHELHGEIPDEGSWRNEKVFEKALTVNLEDLKGQIEMSDIAMKTIREKAPQYVWYWSYRFVFTATRDGQQLWQETLEIDAPIIH